MEVKDRDEVIEYLTDRRLDYESPREIIKEGFIGYENMSDGELIECLDGRGKHELIEMEAIDGSEPPTEVYGLSFGALAQKAIEAYDREVLVVLLDEAGYEFLDRNLDEKVLRRNSHRVKVLEFGKREHLLKFIESAENVRYWYE